jgi:hypothetical protein
LSSDSFYADWPKRSGSFIPVLVQLPFFCICHQDRLQESIEGLKLNGIHYVLIYTNEDNLFVENQITTKKDTKALSVSSMEDFLK